MAESTTSQRLFRPAEAARLLACSERTVWSLIKSGRLPAVRFGKVTRIDRVDIDSFISAAKGSSVR